MEPGEGKKLMHQERMAQAFFWQIMLQSFPDLWGGNKSLVSSSSIMVHEFDVHDPVASILGLVVYQKAREEMERVRR